MRVLFCIPNLNGGGAERVVLSLAEALDPSKVEATVFAHEKWGSLLESLNPSMRIEFYKAGPYTRASLPGLLAHTIRLGSRADIIVGANEGRATFFAAVAAKVLRKPLVAWLHNNWVEFSKVVSWRQRMALRIYNRMDAIVAVSNGVSRAFQSIVPVDPSRIRTLYNGVPRARISSRVTG